jgi:hypothetical protein
MRRTCPLTSAVVLFDPEILKSFVAAMRKDGLKIARDLSIVVVGDSAEVRTTEPPVTCVSFDSKCLAHLALDLVCQQMLEVRRLSRVPPRQRLRLEGTLRERSSVEALQTLPSARTDEAASGANRLARVWPHAIEQRLREAAETWQWPTGWSSMACRLLRAGRSLGAGQPLAEPAARLARPPAAAAPRGRPAAHPRRGFLAARRADQPRAQRRGAALQPFPAHLAPLAAGPARAAGGAQGARRLFPPRLRLCGGARAVRLVRVLPAGAHARAVAAGGPRRGSRHSPDTPPANIQDWWPEFPQFNADGVRHVAITENGDPFAYERYLYSLEWVNPDPDVVLDEIACAPTPWCPRRSACSPSRCWWSERRRRCRRGAPRVFRAAPFPL